MRVLELESAQTTLEEVIRLADKELVLLRRSNGKVYAVTEIEEADMEVELLKRNPEFMAYMQEISRPQPTISSRQLRNELGL